jgi:2-polyprenyl-6-methoxyphenol hydroxylase-like FAD-dependent oxidoreductase
MTVTTILISGAGIAGPTLAYWLKRYGFNPTVIERAAKSREGGYIIDFRGMGVEVVQRMGLWPRVQEEKYDVQDILFVDELNKVIGGFNVGVLSRENPRAFISIKRTDLAKILYGRTKDEVEYIFGESICAIREDAEGVEVAFESGRTRRFDLVVGADGLHSAVRTLAFGDEAQFKRYLGYYVAAFTVHNYPAKDYVIRSYTVPGKIVTLYGLKENGALAYFIFKHPKELSYGVPDTETQKRLLLDAFAGEGWEVPRLLEAMKTTSDFYLDSVSQIRIDKWSHGRKVLIGDAAYCPSLFTGYGSHLAMVGAYILAGELKKASGDYHSAFQKYEDEFRPFVEQKQKNPLGYQVVPGSTFGLWVRNRVLKLMSIPFLSWFAIKMIYGRAVRESFTLKEYAYL